MNYLQTSICILALWCITTTLAIGNDDCRGNFFDMKTSPIICAACKLTIPYLRKLIKVKPVESVIEIIAKEVCIQEKIEDKYVCKEAIYEYQDLFFYLLKNEYFEPEEACGYIRLCPMPKYPGWNVTFSRQKPSVNPYPAVEKDSEKLRILHLTDAHVDTNYTVGYETNCGDPICCRPPHGPGKPGSQAGFWGDHHCDGPPQLLENLLDFVSSEFSDIDFAIVTGDLPPHDVWEITRADALKIEDYINDVIGDKLGVPVYSAVGNHESVPVNQFVPRHMPNSDKYDMGWLYDHLANKWSRWLPEDALKTARYAGYYSTKVADGLRIVSLNTNLGCNGDNWWLGVKLPSNETSDPDEMLHWFANVMDEAELNNEAVYIIKHIAAGHGCGENWWRNYHSIVLRYENNIIAEFAGHTHDDKFHVTYDSDVRPFVTTYFAGSITPNSKNPTFRVVEVDKKTKVLTNYIQYWTNLTEANLSGKPKWEIEYSAAEDYELSDMSPESWHQLSLRMQTDRDLLDQYIERQTRQLVSASFCDENCHQKEVCNLWNAPPDSTHSICGQ